MESIKEGDFLVITEVTNLTDARLKQGLVYEIYHVTDDGFPMVWFGPTKQYTSAALDSTKWKKIQVGDTVEITDMSEVKSGSSWKIGHRFKIVEIFDRTHEKYGYIGVQDYDRQAYVKNAKWKLVGDDIEVDYTVVKDNEDEDINPWLSLGKE
jgi:hypothetical protein